MTEAESTLSLLKKLLVFLLSMVMAASLIVASVGFAATDPSVSQDDLGGAGHRNGTDVLHSVASIAEQTSHFASSITNVHALLRPADYNDIPAIDPPLPIPKVQAPPVQPASHVTPTPAPHAAQPAGANLYTAGNCTWWAADRRTQNGNPIPNSWGNAATWAKRATADGYTVDHQPSPGAIMQTSKSAGGLGHVAYVESVDPDGNWHISEMNVRGLGVIDHTTMAASVAVNYSFIHDKQ